MTSCYFYTLLRRNYLIQEDSVMSNTDDYTNNIYDDCN